MKIFHQCTSMKNTDYAHLLSFIVIVKTGNFTKAAYELGLQPSTLSHNIRLLEKKLGITLLTRTTRQVSPTSAGQAFYDSTSPAFGTIEHAIEALNEFKHPTGTVRLSVPRTVAERIILPKLPSFLEKYPDIAVDVSAENGFVNIIESGFDAGVRLAESLEKDMVAVRISPDFCNVVLASPAYLERHGTPTTPQDLLSHRCIGWKKRTGELQRWKFMQDGKALSIAVPCVLTFNDFDLMLDAAVHGVGLVYLMKEFCSEYIQDGRLVRLLPEWSTEYAGFYLYHPIHSRSASLKALVEHLKL